MSASAHGYPAAADRPIPSAGAPAQPGAAPAAGAGQAVPAPGTSAPGTPSAGYPAPTGHPTGESPAGDAAAHQAAPGAPAAAASDSTPAGGVSPAAPGPHAAAPGAATPAASGARPVGHPASAGNATGGSPAGDGAAPGGPARPAAADPAAHAQPPAAPAAVAGTPVHGQPAPSGGVRLDRRAADDGAAGDDYTLQAPDPRVAAEPHASVCVACRAGRVDDDGYCENCGHAQPRERDHMEQERGPVAAVSDRGLRHHRNEDAFAVGTTTLPDGSPVSLAVVCDGVSSATRPDEASLAASRAANASLLDALPRGTHPQQAMHEAILAASEAVNALAGEQPAEAREHAPQQNAPACTIVGAVVTAGLLVVGWVGDSRAYWIPVDRSAPAARLTEDDSWAAQMVAAGLMAEAEAYADPRAHAITGWLGADAYELEPHTAAFKPDRPGVVVVCTDGLWNYAESADEMAEAVPADAAARPLHAARVLVGHALDGGGHDNVTVALVPFPAVPQGAGSA
ncbi:MULTISPECIES: PP2C family serine/threonine-protein phosphatase [unclassified Streptomyces]|uniref:PP2C family protein-serine/threonine phosphatase n=2 Tax=unclassified Streptomyces TaxID=2593676 RepID=UPI00307B525E